MKKIAIYSLLMCLGYINFASAVCGYEEPRDSSPSNEDIFLGVSKAPDYSKGIPKAIVCGTQQSKTYCENETFVYVKDTHWIKGFGSKSKQMYKCQTSPDSWVERYGYDVPRCPGNLQGRTAFDAANDDLTNKGQKVFYGKSIKDGSAYYNVCYKPVEEYCRETYSSDAARACCLEVRKNKKASSWDGKALKCNCVKDLEWNNEKLACVPTKEAEEAARKAINDMFLARKGVCEYKGIKYNENQVIRDDVSCATLSGLDAKTGETCYLTCLMKSGDKKGSVVESVSTCPKDTTGVEYASPEQIYTGSIPGYKKCEVKGDAGEKKIDIKDGKKEDKDGKKEDKDDKKKVVDVKKEDKDDKKDNTKNTKMCEPIRYEHADACYIMPRDCTLVGRCNKLGEDCLKNYPNSNATRAECVYVKRTSSSKKELSCAAKECSDDSLLWLSGPASNPHSMGICRKKSWVEAQCKKGCGCNNDTEECVPDLRPNPNTGKADAAYFDCKCVAKSGGNNEIPSDGTPVVIHKEDGKCWYSFYGSITCPNGSSYTDYHTFLIDENDCNAYEKQKTLDMTTLLKYAATSDLCKGQNLYVSFDESDKALALKEANKKQVEKAKASLDSFFASIGSGSGLKTADGKFNTVRLASDLTAGVVLGTVGGVVSGVVIKKKQVEKGFDALHCTVGGQTIADWGDTFEVGLQK